MTVHPCCGHCAAGPEDVNGTRKPCGIPHDEPCEHCQDPS
jgi:hypothetical protein